VARQRIGELLIDARVISEEDLVRALAVERTPGQKLGDILVQLGMVSEAQLTQIIGQQHSVPWVSLYHIDFSRQLLNLIPHALADKYCLIPIYVRRVKRQDTLYVAMADPSNESALEEVSKVVGLPAKPMIAAPSDIRNAIRVYYGAAPVKSVPPPKPPVKPPLPDPVSAPKPRPREEEEEEAPPTLLEDPHTVEVAALSNRASEALDAPEETQRLSQTAESPASPDDLRKVSESGDSPDAEPEIEAREIHVKPKFGGPMMGITMLDGTTLQLPVRRNKRTAAAVDDDAPPSEVGGLTARDLIAALRAESQGRDAGAVLGDDGKWEKLYAALLSLMLRKGLIADWEFIDELRKM